VRDVRALDPNIISFPPFDWRFLVLAVNLTLKSLRSLGYTFPISVFIY